MTDIQPSFVGGGWCYSRSWVKAPCSTDILGLRLPCFIVEEWQVRYHCESRRSRSGRLMRRPWTVHRSRWLSATRDATLPCSEEEGASCRRSFRSKKLWEQDLLKKKHHRSLFFDFSPPPSPLNGGPTSLLLVLDSFLLVILFLLFVATILCFAVFFFFWLFCFAVCCVGAIEGIEMVIWFCLLQGHVPVRLCAVESYLCEGTRVECCDSYFVVCPIP